jgi:hypothetical protein
MNFLHMCEYGTLKPVRIILRKGSEERGWGMEGWTKQGTLYAYVEMSQWNPLYYTNKYFKNIHMASDIAKMSFSWDVMYWEGHLMENLVKILMRSGV